MAKKEKKKSPHVKQMAIDITHVIIGAVAVAVSVHIFFDLDARMNEFPVVFFLAALLNFINGIPRIKGKGKRKKTVTYGVFLIVCGVLLTALAGLSAYTMWV